MLVGTPAHYHQQSRSVILLAALVGAVAILGVVVLAGDEATPAADTAKSENKGEGKSSGNKIKSLNALDREMKLSYTLMDCIRKGDQPFDFKAAKKIRRKGGLSKAISFLWKWLPRLFKRGSRKCKGKPLNKNKKCALMAQKVGGRVISGWLIWDGEVDLGQEVLL